MPASSKKVTLVGGVVTTVVLTNAVRGFRLIGTGAGEVRYRYKLGTQTAGDVTDPVVGDQDGTFTLRSGTTDVIEDFTPNRDVTVKLISSGTPTVDVEALA